MQRLSSRRNFGRGPKAPPFPKCFDLSSRLLVYEMRWVCLHAALAGLAASAEAPACPGDGGSGAVAVLQLHTARPENAFPVQRAGVPAVDVSLTYRTAFSESADYRVTPIDASGRLNRVVVPVGRWGDLLAAVAGADSAADAARVRRTYAQLHPDFLELCAARAADFAPPWDAAACADDLVHQLNDFAAHVRRYHTEQAALAAAAAAVLAATAPTVTAPPGGSLHNVSVGAEGNAALLEYLAERRRQDPAGFTVVDVGGSMGGWSFGSIDALVDAQAAAPSAVAPGVAAGGSPALSGSVLQFRLNVNFESEWAPVLAHVKRHGKFKFSLCTHTLEDLALPQVSPHPHPALASSGVRVSPSFWSRVRCLGGCG